jgi:UDP-N-acetylglucosamine diphosphorylase/glucosamine-1-phosphate N-acetyltransferase
MSALLFLYDDPDDLPRFEPFAGSRPIGELRYGAPLLRERWEDVLGRPASGHLAPAHLRDYTEADAPLVLPHPDATLEPRLVVRSAFVPAPDFAVEMPAAPVRFVDGTGATVGAALPEGVAWPGLPLPAAWPSVSVPGILLEGAWRLVADLPAVLQADLAAVAASHVPQVPDGCTVLGDPARVFAGEAAVEPHVVFDVRTGPVWLGRGVEVRAFTRLAGPLAVGPGSRLVGGPIRESSIGPRCVVHGEVSNTVFVGYANKAHDGFLGHSVVGRWVNLGAGTITSNLKNTYGPVRLQLAGGRVETGMTFLGSLIGDHVKTAIGTMLPTGCVLGTGANVFGTRRPGPRVPPFAWGTDDPDAVLDGAAFLQTAARVLPRRDVAFDEATRRWLAAVWTAATGLPCD